MEIEFNSFGPIREVVGEKTVVQEVPADATVETVLSDLVGEYPELSGTLVGEDGDVESGVNLTINGTDVRHLDGLETEIDDGDVLRAAPAVVGGRR